MKDHYTALHILPAATADEIKKAFRRLALQYHPDKNKEPLAHTRFTEVREAYEMLKDPVKRAAYNYKLYSSQSVHTRKAAAQSSADILHESRELARIVSGLDPFRVDLDVISFRVRDIISERNVGILLQEENSSIRIQAVQNIINALQLLPLPLAIDCIRPLQPLVEAYPEIKTEINRFFSNAKWQFYWDRYKVYIALTIAAAACLLILLSVSN